MIEVINGKTTTKKEMAKYYLLKLGEDNIKLIAVECKPDTLMDMWLKFVKDKSQLTFVQYLCEYGIRACEIKPSAELDTINEMIKEVKV